MPRFLGPGAGTVAADAKPTEAIRRNEMKKLLTLFALVVACSQFGCSSLVAGGVGAAVGVAAERERQEDKDD
jgi:hypothetical protein